VLFDTDVTVEDEIIALVFGPVDIDDGFTHAGCLSCGRRHRVVCNDALEDPHHGFINFCRNLSNDVLNFLLLVKVFYRIFNLQHQCMNID
jgi:hypothetical protein